MTTRILGRGHYPAKRAQDLRPGDVIMRPSGRAQVLDVVIKTKCVFLRLAGRDHHYSVNIHKRLGSRVAIVLTPRKRASANPRATGTTDPGRPGAVPGGVTTSGRTTA